MRGLPACRIDRKGTKQYQPHASSDKHCSQGVTVFQYLVSPTGDPLKDCTYCQEVPESVASGSACVFQPAGAQQPKGIPSEEGRRKPRTPVQ